MIRNNTVSKSYYRRLILRDLIFGSKSSLVLLVLYVALWRITYTITKIGQLKTNIPIFIGLCILMFLTFIYIFVSYRKYMKKACLFEIGSRIDLDEKQLVFVSNASTDRHVFSFESLTAIKENKKWYLLYFHEQTMIPISKETSDSLEQVKEWLAGFKPIYPAFWKGTALFFLLVTLVGGYSVGKNAVDFNGALAWKINELKTESRIKLKNDNFYETKLDGILDSVKAEMELEPYLMTNDLEIEFEQDGTMTSIYTYIYGFDRNEELQSGYLIHFDKTKSNRIRVHKQDWNGEGTTVYDRNNDLSIVNKMLELIPVEDVVKRWNEKHSAVLYKGIRNWGVTREGIHFIDENGRELPSEADPENSGPTISLYVPGKEDSITPQRYIYKPFFREE
ncbi:hypothetical protein D1B31_02325 [Neobacillus notoginsengisoli]|uniref:YcxB family protein n=1 Tax=Neobacillus notoginsengisoli TaxID=1578198 RepID=A0A417Z0K2_9BACI|nr:hypothetical protein [Neobacillus notoginsengisoli]RHW43514.1 hypothetical protein D1B31_02325 [Neobacillus notoginsengisoli]